MICERLNEAEIQGIYGNFPERVEGLGVIGAKDSAGIVIKNSHFRKPVVPCSPGRSVQGVS